MAPTSTPTHQTQSPTYGPSDSPTEPTESPSDAPSVSPTPAPTISPTHPTETPTYDPTYAPTPVFWNQIIRGYNWWKDERSPLAIIDPNRFQQNRDSYIAKAIECNFNEMEFGSSFDSYHSYQDAVSQSVGVRFGLQKGASVGAGVYYTKQIFEEQSISHWSYFYSMNLDCVISDASVTGWSQLYWSDTFLHDLVRLPISYHISKFCHFCIFFVFQMKPHNKH